MVGSGGVGGVGESMAGYVGLGVGCVWDGKTHGDIFILIFSKHHGYGVSVIWVRYSTLVGMDEYKFRRLHACCLGVKGLRAEVPFKPLADSLPYSQAIPK